MKKITLTLLLLLFFLQSEAQQKKDTINVVFNVDSVISQFTELLVGKVGMVHSINLNHSYNNGERQIKSLYFFKKADHFIIPYENKKKFPKKSLLSPQQFLNIFRNEYGVLDPYLPKKKFVINVIINEKCSNKFQVYYDYELSTSDFYGTQDTMVTQ